MTSTTPAIVIVGATGFVGRRLTQWFLDEGWAVLACGRNRERLAALRGIGAQTVDITSFDDEASSVPADAFESLGASGDVRGVVSAIGGWWQGERLEELPLEDWQAFLTGHLTAHLATAQRLVPLLPDGAAYVVLNGAASHIPMVRSGPVSVTGAALHMLVEVLRAEQTSVNYREVIVERAIAGDDRNIDPEAEVSLGDVALAIADAIEAGPDVRRVDAV